MTLTVSMKQQPWHCAFDMPLDMTFNQQIYSPRKSNYTYHGHEKFDDFELRMFGMPACQSGRGARCYN